MVSIIACTIRDQMMKNVFENYARQNWEDKELIIILNNDQMDIEKWSEMANNYQNVSIHKIPEQKALGYCLNFGIEVAKYDIVAKFDDDDYYSPYYLSEVMEVFSTTDAQLVGKGKSFMYFEKDQLLTMRILGTENKQGKSGLKGGTLVFRKEIFPNIKFQSIKGGGTDSLFVKECQKKNIKIHTTSRYNYVYIRRGNKNSHTFNRSNAFLKNRSKIIGKITDYEAFVTKPFGTNS